jgi:HEAT repeat protein
LSHRAQSAEIRSALVYLVGHDPNDGVRLKAMEGLKASATEPEVRDALARALLNDSNPGVRTQAIDMLVPRPEDHSFPNIDRAMIGTLQELMLRENNPSVRQRGQRVLEAINASAEIY